MSRAKSRKDLEQYERFKRAFDEFMEAGRVARDDPRRFNEARERLVQARAALP